MTANCVRSGRKFVIGASSISGQADWGGGNERVKEKGDDKMRSGRKTGGGGVGERGGGGGRDGGGERERISGIMKMWCSTEREGSGN